MRVGHEFAWFEANGFESHFDTTTCCDVELNSTGTNSTMFAAILTADNTLCADCSANCTVSITCAAFFPIPSMIETSVCDSVPEKSKRPAGGTLVPAPRRSHKVKRAPTTITNFAAHSHTEPAANIASSTGRSSANHSPPPHAWPLVETALESHALQSRNDEWAETRQGEWLPSEGALQSTAICRTCAQPLTLCVGAGMLRGVAHTLSSLQIQCCL